MREILARTAMSDIVMAGLLFLPAGTLAWPQAWIFIALFNACGIAIGLWLAKADPALLAERMKSPLAEGQRLRDRAVMTGIMLVLCLWLVLMGFDTRFGWSRVAAPAQALGAALIVAAFAGWTAVLRANSFAGTRIRLQHERRQRVVDTGPYAVIRHPMYAFCVFLFLGAPLLLGSWWGLTVLIAAMPLMAARAIGEEAQMMEGLPGYRDYAARVRHRLLPGLW